MGPGPSAGKAGIDVAGTVVAGSAADLDDLLSTEAIDRPANYYAKVRSVHPVYWNQALERAGL